MDNNELDITYDDAVIIKTALRALKIQCEIELKHNPGIKVENKSRLLYVSEKSDDIYKKFDEFFG